MTRPSRILFFLLLSPLSLFAQDYQVDEIEVIRDKWGVPHIYAPTDAGVGYGLAWAHAEDDFKTIQLTMLAGQQRLGEYLGKDGAAVDYVVGLMRCKELAKAEIPTFSEPYRKLITAYMEGLNRYAATHPKEVLVKGSFPVNLEEVMAAYALSLAAISGADRTISELFEGKVRTLQDGEVGSNGFAFSRKITTDDYVYLNVNSHQPLEGPAAWYEAHLVSGEGWNIIGGLFPGAATVFIGANEHLGWTHTVNHPDKIDVFQLEINPENEYQYKMDGEWKELEHREIPLRVKLPFGLKIRVKKEALWSEYGPAVRNKKGTFSFDLGALHNLKAPDQWYQMNKATSWEEYRKAIEMVAIPGFNFIYADRMDNIFYLGNAIIPYRNAGFDWLNTLPGDTSATLINRGFHPLSDLPQLLNPQSGYLYNTNNSAFLCSDELDNPKPENYDATMGYRVFDNNRSLRFRELMKGVESIDYETFKKIKYDRKLPQQWEFPANLEIVLKLDSTKNMKYAPLLKIFQTWDFDSQAGSIGPAHLMIFYQYLIEKYKDEYVEFEKFNIKEEQAWDAIAFTHRYLMKHFGRLGVPLGEYQKLVRGNISLPAGGIHDVLAAMYSVPHENGRVKVAVGESYIMLVRFPVSGLPIIETVNAYGASNVSGNKHYADQMILFLNQRTKPMTLDLDEVRKNAEAIYHPK